MSLGTLLSQLAEQLQFVGLMRSLNVPWPKELDTALAYISSIATLNPAPLLEGGYLDASTFQFLPVITFRLLFTLIAVALPTLLVILTLFITLSIGQTLLWAVVVCGLVLSGIALIGSLVPQLQLNVDLRDNVLLYIAAAMLCVGIIGYVISVCVGALKKEDVEEVQRDRLEQRAINAPLTFCMMILAFVLAGVSVVFFLALHPFLPEFKSVFFACGIISAMLGALLLIIALATTTQKGRNAVAYVREGLEVNSMHVLVAMSLVVFMPACSYCLSVFMCTTYTCPAGTLFNPLVPRRSSYDTSAAVMCDVCTFENPGCGPRNVTALCPAQTYHHNWLYPMVSCTDAAHRFFLAASGVVLFSFVLAIPMIHLYVTHSLTKAIRRDAVIESGEVGSGDPTDAQWAEMLTSVRCVMAPVYDPFKYPMRYFSAVLTLQRLLFVVLAIVVAPLHPMAAVVLLLGINVVFMIVLLVARPYLLAAEMVLSVLLQLSNVINSAMAVYLQVSGLSGEQALQIFLIVVNIVPVAIGVVITAVISLRRYTHLEALKAERPMDGVGAMREDVDPPPPRWSPIARESEPSTWKGDDTPNERDARTSVEQGNAVGSHVAPEEWSIHIPPMEVAIEVVPAVKDRQRQSTAESTSSGRRGSKSLVSGMGRAVPLGRRESREEARRKKSRKPSNGETQKNTGQHCKSPLGTCAESAASKVHHDARHEFPEIQKEGRRASSGSHVDSFVCTKPATVLQPSGASNPLIVKTEDGTAASMKRKTPMELSIEIPSGDVQKLGTIAPDASRQETDVPAARRKPRPPPLDTIDYPESGTPLNLTNGPPAAGEPDNGKRQSLSVDANTTAPRSPRIREISLQERSLFAENMTEEQMHNESLKVYLDVVSQRFVGRWFQVNGTLLFLALGAAILGVQLSGDAPYRVASDPLHQTLKFTTNNMPTWTQFVGTCCCLKARYPPENVEIAERWVCPDGTVLLRERIRKISDVTNNGTALRRVCAVTPTPPSCAINVTNGRLGLSCSSSVVAALIPAVVSRYSYDYLF